MIDGAWWPYSRDAATELPGLIAAVDQRLGRTTLLVGVSRDAWQRIPRRIPARGRQVRIGWFRHADPHVIVLFFAADTPVALLVIPPETAAGPAEAALKLTAQDTASLTADDVLILARLPPDPAPPLRATIADSLACQQDEGGSLTRQETASSTRGPTAPA